VSQQSNKQATDGTSLGCDHDVIVVGGGRGELRQLHICERMIGLVGVGSSLGQLGATDHTQRRANRGAEIWVP
jgi:hypothetical protein